MNLYLHSRNTSYLTKVPITCGQYYKPYLQAAYVYILDIQ